MDFVWDQIRRESYILCECLILRLALELSLPAPQTPLSNTLSLHPQDEQQP